MIEAVSLYGAVKKKKKLYKKVTKPKKKVLLRSAGMYKDDPTNKNVNPYDIGKYYKGGKKATEKDRQEIEKWNKIVEEEKRKVREAEKKRQQTEKGYYSDYDESTKTITIEPREDYGKDVELNPVQDFKELDKAITDKIIETGQTMFDEVKETVSQTFNFEWYHWLLIGGGSAILLYMITKVK